MRSVTLTFLAVILLRDVCGVDWLGVPIVSGLSRWFASLIVADWIRGEYQMLNPGTVELWLAIAGSAWLLLSTSKRADEIALSVPRVENRPAIRPAVARPVQISTAQDLIEDMTHEEWRGRVFGKRPTTTLPASTVEFASKTG